MCAACLSGLFGLHDPDAEEPSYEMFHRFKARRSGGLGGRAAGQSDAQAATAPARAEPARPRLRYGGRGWAGYIDQEG